MILNKKSKKTGENKTADEVSRLMKEIEDMKEISRISEERNRLISEKLELLNAHVVGPTNTNSRKTSNDSENEAAHTKYPEIQILIESDENSLSRVLNLF
jgi:signal transduction histidine kinase